MRSIQTIKRLSNVFAVNCIVVHNADLKNVVCRKIKVARDNPITQSFIIRKYYINSGTILKALLT